MYQYRVIYRIGVALRRTFIVVGFLLGLFITMEVLRLAAMFHRLHPIAALVFAGIMGLFSIYGIWRILAFIHDHDTLHPDELPRPENARHKDLVSHCRHLVRVLRRLAQNGYLSEDQQMIARKNAYEIEELLHAHPLIEDLTRAIVTAEQKVIDDLYLELDKHAEAMARDKMKATVADVIQPPFPVINAAVVFYHQFTLSTAIAGVYVSEPALFEYGIILRDVWRVMTRGDFIRIGQSLFSGVYANCPPMGSAIDDLGQAISCIWLTQSVAEATMHRTKSLRVWHLEDAIAAMDARCHAGLAITRDALIKDVMPILKTAFHHKVPRGEDESPVFMSNLITGITKSVDAVIATLKTVPIEQTVQVARRTSDGELDIEGGYVVLRQRSKRRRSGGRSNVGSIRKIFRTISQRIKYSSRYPRY